MKKEKEVFIVQIVELNFSTLKQNMRVDQVGLHFMSLYLMYLRPKQIITLVTLELNIIVKIVVGIMVTSLRMDHNLQEKGIAITVFV